VFEIKNSDRILQNIKANINKDFEKKFSQNDSIIIFDLSKQCEITKYGYAKNDEKDLIIL
jgi:CRISPR-associated protein Cas2